MSSDRDHDKNPPAFPKESTLYGHEGMTLRDYFAAAALQGLLAQATETWLAGDLAAHSYVAADAMLAVRAEKASK